MPRAESKLTRNLQDPMRRRQIVEGHKRGCGLCTSPLANEIDYRLLMGHDPREVLRWIRENGGKEPPWKTWKTHREVVSEVANPEVHERIRKEAKKKNEVDEPLDKLETRFLAGLMGDAMPEVVTAISERIRKDDPDDQVTFGQLLQFLDMAVKVTQLMLGQPTERRESVEKQKHTVTLDDVLKGIQDPTDKAAALDKTRKLGDALQSAQKQMEDHIKRN